MKCNFSITEHNGMQTTEQEDFVFMILRLTRQNILTGKVCDHHSAVVHSPRPTMRRDVDPVLVTQIALAAKPPGWKKSVDVRRVINHIHHDT